MTQYIGIHSEGGLIPYDVLDKIAKEESGLGQQAKDFGLPAGRRLTDEIARAWSDAQDYWHIFQRRSSTLPADESGATLTRKWLGDLLELLGYELALQQAGVVIGGKNYPISHHAGASEESPPVQIEGFRTDVDKRPQARRLSPQALVQEYLNNSDSQLWGIVTNGVLLRLLRDTSRTSRPSYLEFNLESILEGNRFNEFALFYRVCHRTRLPRTAEDSTSCWLEKYLQLSIEQGGRVRDKLRDGVEDALKTLGTGFLRHPNNGALRDRAKAGMLTAAEFHRQLLRLVYRLLFLMVAEERRMIVPEGPEADRRQSLFDRYYSVGRLRALAEKPIEASTFGDLWIGLRQTFTLFEDGDSNPLGVPPLNGDLFSAVAVRDLQGTYLYNDLLLAAMQRLSLFEDHRVRQRVNYSALDVEELGSVYESLLDFQPAFAEQPDGMIFDLRTGSERKSTGSYYTRPELVRELIESTLVPVMQDRLAGAKDTDPTKDREKKEHAILSMSVCDPACGSGHFLLAAARRLGRELAKVRTGEDEPIPKEFHLAVRDVIAHCVYGVDVNPLAVDLCKLALWLEGHWTGKPLSFLDNRIKCGNSLIGVLDMAVLKEGIPDDAFNPVTGDDKKIASAFKKDNRDERKGQASLPFDITQHVHEYATEYHKLTEIAEETPAGVREKSKAYHAWRGRADWWHDWTACNIWTAAFFVSLTNFSDLTVPTHDRLLRFVLRQDGQPQMAAAANALAEQLRFFHWRLEFPEVFERGRFDLVIGNPPWERIKLQEKEHWLDDPYIANAPLKVERLRRIEEYRQSSDTRKQARIKIFEQAKHAADAETKFVRASDRFPLAATGDINTYALFTELARDLAGETGRLGLLVPVGIVTDATTKDLFGAMVKNGELVSVLGFENEAFIFPAVHHAFKFCALTVAGSRADRKADFVFFCRNFDQVHQRERHFELSRSDLSLLSPNTLTCPTFRSRTDALLTQKLYRKFPVLVHEASGRNPWGVTFSSMFHMTSDSKLFHQAPAQGLVRLYEAKMMYHFDHRWGTYKDATQAQLNMGNLPAPTDEQKGDRLFETEPKHWVAESEVSDHLSKWKQEWLFGFRDITAAMVDRTSIFTILPKCGIGNTITLLFPTLDNGFPLICCLLANLNSLVTDFVVRTKLTYVHLSQFVLKQIVVLPPGGYLAPDLLYVVPRVLELVCVCRDVEPFGLDVWAGSDASLQAAIAEQLRQTEVNSNQHCPSGFHFNPMRRFLIRAELDAYYAHLYGLTRDELRYFLDPKDVFGEDFPSETFRVLKEREEKELGEYRTRRLVLEAFDKLAESPRFRDEMRKRESAFSLPETKLVSAGN